MRRLGNKVAARNLAIEVGVPVVPATAPLPDDMEEVARMAEEVGYPVMLKASWGGGGHFCFVDLHLQGHHVICTGLSSMTTATVRPLASTDLDQ